MRNTPAGFSSVHYAMIPEDNVPQYCVHHELDRPMTVVNKDEGVAVSVGPCVVSALVEFHAPPKAAPVDMHDPANWRVGFVQAYDAGAIVYEYGGGATHVRAAIGPEHTPCRDSDGLSVFYDRGAMALQTFGPEGDGGRGDAGLPSHVVPFLDAPEVRYVEMEDRPGSGSLPLILPCRQAGDPRAIIGHPYTMGWTDPLDPRPAAGASRLHRIHGAIAFRTWLVMQYAPTGRLYALHLFEWEARFDLEIHGPLFNKGGTSGSRLIRETAVKADLPVPIGAGPDANAMACVKFLPH